MSLFYAIVFVLVLIASWWAQLFGLPGNWLIVVVAALYAWLVPAEAALDWRVVVALVVLAVLGEIVEFAAGALGVAKRGGSRRGAVLAIVGSMIGGIIGAFVGLPVPVVGSILAAVLFAGLGALVGAFLGESWKGRDFDTSLEIGKAAFIGRILGTAGKMVICTVMVLTGLLGLVL